MFRIRTRATAALSSLLVVAAACDQSPTPIVTGAAPTAAHVTAPLQSDGASFGPEVNQDLALLRQVTAQFHDFATASRAGWSAAITPCMSDPAGSGAMGIHYGKPSLITDGTVRVDQPELLMYEPEKNGRLRLVGVEYIVPLALWTSPNPPRLFGRDFKVNEAFQVWGLHAWVWKENPSGMFADWNPTVSCVDASTQGSM